jgi:general secretion pathway protein D
MRIIVCILLLWSTLLQSAEVSIKTLSIAGKTTYLIYAGTFSLQSNAINLENKLRALIKEPITVDYIETKKLYLVEIGPLNDYLAAQQLQKKIIALTATSQANPPSTDETKTSIPPYHNETPTTPSPFSPEAMKPLPEISKESAPQTNHESASLSAEEINASNETVQKQLRALKERESALQASKTWNLRNADIRAVIAEVSRITGKNFVIDPRVQGKISIVSSSPLTNRELYQVFLSMLQVSGYSAILSGNITKIIPALDAKTQAPDRLSLMKHPPSGEEMMVQVIPVKYVPAEQLVPVLRPLMPNYSSVSAYPASNMLILSGQANNIKQLSQIINQVDSSSANGIDIVPLHQALAMDIVNTLKDLVKSPQNGLSSAQTTIAADDRSNAILLSGSKTERIRLRLIISRLDKKGANGDSSNTQVVYLNYLRAEDLVPILAGVAQANFTGIVGTTIGTVTRPALDSTSPASSLVGNGSKSSGDTAPLPTPSEPQGGGNNPQAGNNKNEGSTKPTVQIIAEPNTNSVIINAPVTLIRTLKTVINQLDIRPAQLIIEALVAEVNETDVNSLGIEWGSVNQATRAPDSFHAGFAIINSDSRINQLEARIFALARDRRANILSKPSVVVLDNRQAKILIGKQVSIASTSYPNNANGTTAGGSPYTTYDRVNVALHLYVRPQITHGRGIQLQIDQGNDTLDTANTIDPGTTPTFNISSIVTSVHVESGDVVVLGGLIQDSVGNDDNRLPILGDIPGIGRLFQHNISNREKKVLMVFIRPGIIRNERDELRVTGSKYNDVRQTELDFIRKEDYDPRDKNTVLKPLISADLPKPFTRPAVNPSMVTK